MPGRLEFDVDISSYPRPQLRRSWWQSLDGEWEFALEAQGVWRDPAEVRWTRRIRVPIAPECEASGIGDAGFHEVCWYRRTIDPPELGPGERLLLRFNAVDHAARVWANGRFAGEHTGGYTPFHFDLTALAGGTRGEGRGPGGPIEIVVRAEDDPQDLAKPRGKQDWRLEPHSIWYPRTSGIWQTVWLERLPKYWIDSLRWTPNLERWEIGLHAVIGGPPADLRLRLRLAARGRELANDSYLIVAQEVSRRIALSDPGIDDYRNEILWSPYSPTLIDAELELVDAELDEVLDAIESYTALRTIAVQESTVVLNGRPFPLRMVLDQGYWPKTGMTAPDGAALKRDVELAKEMGFNGVRKHQKIEDERYLYWADRLGLLVWTEMPSPYRFTTTAIERLTREWLEVIHRDYSHPCVVVWVPFNESWGVPNLPDIAAQRNFVSALYHLTHTLDPTRLVIGNDGWESVATDIVGIHDYDESPDRIAARYRLGEERTHLFRHERPGGRMLTLEGHAHHTLPLMITEFGGIAFCDERTGFWGYSCATSLENLEARYTALLEVVRKLPTIAGFCYTQFADTYQEANGLLFADRTPKFPIERIADATRGPRVPRQGETTESAAPAGTHSSEAP